MDHEMEQLLALSVKENASDLHLAVGAPPSLRIQGDLSPVDFPNLTPEISKRLVYSILTEEQKAKFEKEWELDFSYAIEGLSRFRVNVYFERGNVGAAFRVISAKIESLEKLGLPPIVGQLARKPHGLVVVTGPVGVGKTTTLAAMLDLINRERKCRILTIEDPIEYIYQHNKSIIFQREVYSDTKSFSQALIHAFREDPNVICVGEMRDLDTISTALTAAETGHLILATLHTAEAAQAVDRVIDVFPGSQQQQIRVQLAMTLEGIIAQQLLPRADGKGRVAAVEVLIATPAVRNLIREGKEEQILNVMQTSAKFGMQTMDQALKDLYVKEAITYEVAVSKAKDPQEFQIVF
jgi:twitching motility protein PilT